ncbi:unnamed protein product [Rodentolepis nana]|uniref:PAPA-1 domain-containing protein n=1 Tax=Rodentolepis nana TaxID=102285 RepID=A0A0R3TCW4_RODNA|nr:unnamed protein product [Rodentolepis nana]
MKKLRSSTATSENSHIPKNIALNQSFAESPNSNLQNSNFQEAEAEYVPKLTFCGLISSLRKQKRNSNTNANESENTDEKDVELADNDKEISQNKDFDHTPAGGSTQINETIKDTEEEKLVGESYPQPGNDCENAGNLSDLQIKEPAEKAEMPQNSETILSSNEVAVPANLNGIHSHPPQPSKNIVVSSFKHSVISLEEPECGTLQQGKDLENLQAVVHTHSKTTLKGSKVCISETSNSTKFRITFKGKLNSAFKKAKNCHDGKVEANAAENEPIDLEPTIEKISDDEETYDHANQSNNNAANDISNATIEYALPEQEKKPTKFLQLIREARAANMVPPSLPVPSYSWEKKEVTDEGNCMVLPTRKPKKRDEKASTQPETETTSSANNAIKEDNEVVEKSKPAPSLQDVIEKMQKIKEVEAELRAKREKKQLEERQNNSVKSGPFGKSAECEKGFATLNYKERRRLKREKEIEEARKELMETARSALKDRLEFNKTLKSANNSENVSITLFGVSSGDNNQSSIASIEVEKSLDSVENVTDNVPPLKSDERMGDNSNLPSNLGLKDNEKMLTKQSNTSGRDSSAKSTKESEKNGRKKKKRKKNHSSKHATRGSITASLPWGQQNIPLLQTAGALQTIPNLPIQQPILVPVPICMSCCGAPQTTQPICYNPLSRSLNPRVLRKSRRCSTSSSEAYTSSDCDSYGQKSKRRPKRCRNRLSCSDCSSFSDTSASFEMESPISRTNSTCSTSSSYQKCFSYTTSLSTSYDTTSECSRFYSSTTNSDNDFS